MSEFFTIVLLLLMAGAVLLPIAVIASIAWVVVAGDATIDSGAEAAAWAKLKAELAREWAENRH